MLSSLKMIINDGGEFRRSCKEIYHPPVPELKKQKMDFSEGSLVDLGIKIVLENLIFSFMIKEMISHFQQSECHILLVTNPQNVLFCIWSKHIQTAHTVCKYETFDKTSENLISRMTKQGDDINVFTRTLTKIYGKHFQIFQKFYNISKAFFESQIN